MASERGHQHQSVAVDDRYREHRRACLTRPATDSDEFDEGHPESSAEDPSLRDVEDRPVNTGAHLVERVFGCHATMSISLRVSYLGDQYRSSDLPQWIIAVRSWPFDRPCAQSLDAFLLLRTGRLDGREVGTPRGPHRHRPAGSSAQPLIPVCQPV